MKSFWLLICCISAFLLFEKTRGYSLQNYTGYRVNESHLKREKRETAGQRILGQVDYVLCRFGLKKCLLTKVTSGGEVRYIDLNLPAAEILSSLDPTVNPCDNFYKFACGNFIKNKVIPETSTSVSQFTEVSNEIQKQLLSVLSEKTSPTDPKAFTLAKTLFQACMNQDAIEKVGLKDIKADLTKLGGWPVLVDNWQSSAFNWKTWTYKTRDMGYAINIFNTLEVKTDPKDSSKRMIEVRQPDFGLNRVHLVKGINDPIVKAYYDYMVDIAVIFGAKKDKAETEMKSALEFAIRLAAISETIEETRNVSAFYNPMTVKQTTENFPNVNWELYINNLFKISVPVTNDEIINVATLKYFNEFEKVLLTASLLTRANYFMWRTVQMYIPYLTKEVRNRQQKFLSILSGTTESVSRSEECLQKTTSLLPRAVDSLYVQKFFDPEIKRRIVELVTNLQKTFRKILQNTKWMDSNTKKMALKKADSMSFFLAYADELLDNAKVTERFNNLFITADNYQQSLVNITLFNLADRFGRYRIPVNKSDWLARGQATIVDSTYDYVENSISLAAGILQKAFFNINRPRYMNYAAIGWIIGHDISHAFGEKGSQYDVDGNLVTWWEEKTKNNYNKKTPCIVEQYGNYVSEVDLKVNGVNTQIENTADNGGIKTAQQAYSAWVKKNGKELKLPNLNYSQSQLFWISAAQVWCEKMRPAAMTDFIQTVNRSPAEFRVLGSFSNMPQFAKDFKCKTGTNMNPKKKCAIW